MQSATAVLNAIVTMGSKRMRLKRAYRLLFNPNLYRHLSSVHAQVALPELIQKLRTQTFRWGQDQNHDQAVIHVMCGLTTSWLSGRNPDFVHGLVHPSGLHSALKAARTALKSQQWVASIDLPYAALLSNGVWKKAMSRVVRDGRFIELWSRYFDTYPEPSPEVSMVLSGVIQPHTPHGVCTQLSYTDLDDHLEATRLAWNQSRDHRQLKCLRYSNALLLSISGDRESAENLVAEVSAILHGYVGAEPESRDAAKLKPWIPGTEVEFLGYRLCHRPGGLASLRTAPQVIRKVSRPFQRAGKSEGRGDRAFLDDEQITDLFSGECEAVHQFYALAEDRNPLRGFRQTLKGSWARTMAHKHRCSVNAVLGRSNRSVAGVPLDWLPKDSGPHYRANRIDDVQVWDRDQVRTGEPCAVKVACTVRREAFSL